MVYHKLRETEPGWASELFAHDGFDEFIAYLRGKSIIVVGNSPCELGKNKGAMIDSYDVVVRFNNYHENFDQYAADYGTKINVWVHAGNDGVNFSDTALEQSDYVFFHSESKYRPHPYRTKNIMKVWNLNKQKVVLLPIDEIRAVRKRFPRLPNMPSAGLFMLELFDHLQLNYRFCGVKLDDQAKGHTWRYNHEQYLSNVGHDWQKESKLLQRYIHRRI